MARLLSLLCLRIYGELYEAKKKTPKHIEEEDFLQRFVLRYNNV